MGAQSLAWRKSVRAEYGTHVDIVHDKNDDDGGEETHVKGAHEATLCSNTDVRGEELIVLRLGEVGGCPSVLDVFDGGVVLFVRGWHGGSREKTPRGENNENEELLRGLEHGGSPVARSLRG